MTNNLQDLKITPEADLFILQKQIKRRKGDSTTEAVIIQKIRDLSSP